MKKHRFPFLMLLCLCCCSLAIVDLSAVSMDLRDGYASNIKYFDETDPSFFVNKSNRNEFDSAGNTIILDTLDADCFDSLVICGYLDVVSSFTFLGLDLRVFHNGSQVGNISSYTYDPVSGRYCFTLSESFLNTLITPAGFDVYAVATLRDPSLHVVQIVSESANPNTGGHYDNDFYTGGGCCPDYTHYMNLDTAFCLLGEGFEEHIFEIGGNIDLNSFPDGYEFCDNKPDNFDFGYINYNQFNYNPGTNKIHFNGVLHITDWGSFTSGGNIVTGEITLCNDSLQCVFPIVMTVKIDSVRSCPDSGDICSTFRLTRSITKYYNSKDINWSTWMSMIFPFQHAEDSLGCDITDWYYQIRIVTIYNTSLLIGSTEHIGTFTPPVDYFWFKWITWPVFIDPIANGIKLTFWNNCGDTCNITVPMPFTEAFQSGPVVKDRTISNSNTSLTLVPNPAGDLVTINYNLACETGRLVVTDVSGKHLFERKLNDAGKKTEINTSSLQTGFYFVMIYGNDGSMVYEKLSIMH